MKTSIRAMGHRIPRVLAFCLAVMLIPLPAAGQSIGGSSSGGGSSAGSKKGKQDPNRGLTLPTAPQNAGSNYGRIAKYEAAQDEKDENLVGILTVIPFDKATKTLVLRVHQRDNFTVSLAGKDVKLEDLPDVLTKGLFVTVGWGVEGAEGAPDEKAKTKKKNGRKNLNILSLDEIPVEGEISKVEGDVLTLRVRPREGAEWRHVDEERKGSQKTQPNARPKPPAVKTFKVKVIDTATVLKDVNGDKIDLGSLQADQPIEATIVPSMAIGYLHELKVVTGDRLAKVKEPTGPIRPPTREEPPRGGGARGGGGAGG